MTHSQSVTLSGSLRVDLHRYTKGLSNDTLDMKCQVKSRSICKFAYAMDFTDLEISHYFHNKIPVDCSQRDERDCS